MKKLESSLLNMVVVLTVISVIAGGVLAYVNKMTAGPIEQIKKETLNNALKSVLNAEQMPQVTATENIDEWTIVYKTDNGTAVQAATDGFGGKLKVLVGFTAEGAISGYSVLEHAETPGLGAKAGDWFQEGGKGCIIGKKPAEKELTVSKDGGDVDAITASTITSRAFLQAVNNAYKAYAGAGVDGASQASPQAQASEACCGNCKQEDADCKHDGSCQKEGCQKEGCKHDGACQKEGCQKEGGCKHDGACQKKACSGEGSSEACARAKTTVND